MKKCLFLFLVFAAHLAHAGESVAAGSSSDVRKEPPNDSVAITSQSAFRATTSPGAAHPDRVWIKLHVRYELAGVDQGSLSLALNEKDEMDFSTFDSAPVKRGQGDIELKAEVRMFERDTLRCLVLLKKTASAPGDKPLAVAQVSIDLKQLRSTRHRS